MICLELPKYVEFFRNSKKHFALRLPCVDIASTPPYKTISFCTTCMNRLSDFQQTIFQNIEDNKFYPNLEFVLLDYSSGDELSQWVKDNLHHHMLSGRLNYYRTERHTHYKPSHSRNVSFRLAQGEIIVNVDADNYVGIGFARHINLCMSTQDNHVMAIPENFLLPDSDKMLLQGRFALYRQDLHFLGGFDEHLDDHGGYSNEDVDLVFRAMMSRYQVVGFSKKHMKRIYTPVERRTINMAFSRNDYNQTKAINEKLIGQKLGKGQIQVNPQGWGRDVVVKNFTEKILLD